MPYGQIDTVLKWAKEINAIVFELAEFELQPQMKIIHVKKIAKRIFPRCIGLNFLVSKAKSFYLGAKKYLFIISQASQQIFLLMA